MQKGVELLAHFNAKALTDYFMLDENTDFGILVPIVNEFVSSYDTYLTSLQENLITKNYQSIQQTAHSLKSSSRLLGLEIIGELCAKIEEDAAQKKCDPKYVEELVKVSPTSIGELQNHIKLHVKQG